MVCRPMPVRRRPVRESAQLEVVRRGDLAGAAPVGTVLSGQCGSKWRSVEKTTGLRAPGKAAGRPVRGSANIYLINCHVGFPFCPPDAPSSVRGRPHTRRFFTQSARFGALPTALLAPSAAARIGGASRRTVSPIPSPAFPTSRSPLRRIIPAMVKNGRLYPCWPCQPAFAPERTSPCHSPA